MKPIRGILLDVDGTLVVSNDAHAYAWARALKESGHNVSFNEIRPLMGMGGDKLMPKVCGVESDSDEGKKISERRGKIFKQDYLPSLRPTNGAEVLMKTLKERGLKMAVASSSKEDELKSLLKVCKADRYIEDSTSSDDAENSKPDPDILHAALETLALNAEEVVMIGDTPYDIEASRKAGIRVIGLTCGGWTEQDLSADEVYSDPEELAARINQSMLGKAI